MQQDIINSLVMVNFYMCGKNLNFDEINSMLKIPNFEIRKSESFLYKEFAKDYWSTDTGYKCTEDIGEQINLMLSLLKPRIETIKRAISKFNAECGFVIVIKGCNDSLPAIYFEQDFIKMSAELGADINLDFC